MNLNLKDKIIIVSGGAKGIGEGIVRVLANEGAIPVIIGRNSADNLILVNSLEKEGKKSYQFTAELSDPEQCKTVIAEIANQCHKIDGLVNNAGVNDGVNLENGDYERFMSSIHSNLVHYYLLAQNALPYLKISKGSIVNIGSKVAETGQGGTSGYAGRHAAGWIHVPGSALLHL